MKKTKKKAKAKATASIYSFDLLTVPALEEMVKAKWRPRRAERLSVTALYDGGLDFSLEVLLRGIQIHGMAQGGSGCMLIEKKTRDVEWTTRYAASALHLVQVLKRIRGVRVRLQRYTWSYRKAA